MKTTELFQPTLLQIELMQTMNSYVKEKRLDDFLLDKEEIEALRELAEYGFVFEGSPDWGNKDKTTAWWLTLKGQDFLDNID